MVFPLKPLPLFALKLLDAFLGRGKIFRHGPAESLDRLANLSAHVEMRLIGLLLSLDSFTPQFCFRLCGAK